MSSDRIDTPDALPSDLKESPDPVIKKTALNVHAEEFRPTVIKQKLQLRPNAPEFIPERIRTQVKPEDSLYVEITDLIQSEGVPGMRIRDIPLSYFTKYAKFLDLTNASSSDLSVFLKEMGNISVLEAPRVIDSMRSALVDAGFLDASSPSNKLAMGCENFFERSQYKGVTLEQGWEDLCPLGADAEKVAVDATVSQFVNELRTFKDSIVEVACRNATGVLLSSFPAEWEKSFIAKGLLGMPGFTELTTRFHVVNLVDFLQSIPSLELVPARESDVLIRPRAPLTASKSVVVLDNELFGGEADRTDSPVTVGIATGSFKGIKQHISPVLASQLLGQVEKQVLELGSHLASKGLQTSSSDLVSIRLQLQQLQSLKISLQTVLSTPQAPKVNPSGAAQQPSAYAALLSQAAQFAMSAISGNAKQKTSLSSSHVSTAVSSRKPSPTSSPPVALSKEDLRELVSRLVETKSLIGTSNLCGIAVSSIKEEWPRMFPALEPLETYLSQQGLKDLKSLLLCEKSLVVFYATLPSPQLRVALRKHFEKSSQRHVTVMSPLISPSSTCSYTSERENAMSDEPCTLDMQRMLTELLLKNIRTLQIAAVRARARSGDASFIALAAVLDVVEKQKSSRLLDSKRPPPIDTGSSSLISSMVKQFVSVSSDILISKAAIAALNVADVPGLWLKEFKTEFPISIDQIASVPGIKIMGTKCTLTALANPGAIVASVFALNDPAVWTSSNTNLVEAVKRVLKKPETTVSHAQLSELSSVLFKSIMAGGPKSAKDCAGALKLLASKDPKAIHEIVASHIVSLQGTSAPSEEAANAFVSTLVEKGKQVKKREKKEGGGLEKLMAQLKQQVHAPPPGLNESFFPRELWEYSAEKLAEIRSKMDSLGQLDKAPEGLKSIRISRKLQ